MFIQTETTPNPDSLKFLPGVTVFEGGVVSFQRGEDVSRSPLANRLFGIDGIETVFLTPDYITLTKNSEIDWIHLKPAALATIMEHFIANLPVVIQERQEPMESTVSYDVSDPIIKQIVEIIDTRVRPAVAQDGGDITFDHFVDGVVYVRMAGACAGCPSSTATLKAGMENMLRYYVPEVTEVRAI